ncbi:TetR/AcrR family transcriptional regulator [Streptomyces massasporeus]|uniref:TetR/AcrR family transcriptional regulator n=1 Tax=Streptomyces massasporeus TaxID=67324 RepID=UPI0033DD8198
MTAARDLFAEHGVSGVTTQQIAHRADAAIGALYLYASTKAELLIMVQNEKFAAAIDSGLAAANATVGQGALEPVIALIRPVVECLREHTEDGRAYRPRIPARTRLRRSGRALPASGSSALTVKVRRVGDWNGWMSADVRSGRWRRGG